jgi:hypothetical protein
MRKQKNEAENEKQRKRRKNLVYEAAMKMRKQKVNGAKEPFKKLA